MTRASLYAGPGKVYKGTTALFPEGETGQIDLRLEQESDEVAAGMFGRVDETQADCTLKMSVTPFDNWGALGILYPAYIKTPAAGTRIFTASDVPTKIWTPGGRMYTILASAVTKCPDLHLGVGRALFGPCEISGVIANSTEYGDASSFITIAESSAADPGGQFTMADFVRGAWIGEWGAAGGFVSGVQAEDEWTVSVEAKFHPLKVQKLTRDMELDSVKVMAKCKPVGPTHTQILTALRVSDAGVLGERRGGATNAADLILTGPLSKTITIKQAQIFGTGYSFGGTTLGTGEIGFVAALNFTAGVAQPLIAFSA